MDDTQSPGSTRNTTVEEAIDRRLQSLAAGAYRSNSRTVLTQFAAFLAEQRDVTRLSEVAVLDCRRYAQELRRRVRQDDLSAASAQTYFDIVRAFWSWAVDDERVESNPARPNRASEPLPADRGEPDRQFWDRATRERLLRFVDERAERSLDGRGDVNALVASRDRAAVVMLSLTGVRAAEIFASSRDERRNGLSWDDVDLDRGVATVLGKTRERQPVPLLDRVVSVLDRYRRLREPPSGEWPVFPTRHAPSLRRAARDRLAARGWDTDEIEATLDEHTGREVVREYEIVPPALTTNGARNLLQRLCHDAGIDIDGEYLKPHGGRRGLGSEIYEQDAELAQETLRHQSVETTHAAYRDRNVAAQRDRIEAALSRDEDSDDS